MRRSYLLLTLGALLFAPAVLGGCKSGDSAPGPTPQEAQTSSRLNDIYKKTGGDWNKLSADDKSFLVNDLGHGSESTAKMLFGAKSGGAPSGGKPGGAPAAGSGK